MKTRAPAPAGAVTARPERSYAGLAASGGIAIGPAHVLERAMGEIPEHRLAEADVAAELARFADAVARARDQIERLRGKIEAIGGATAAELLYLLEAHLQMLSGSRLLRGVERRISEQRLNAEASVQAELRAIAEEFDTVSDPYLAARVHDIRDVGVRLVRSLINRPYKAFTGVAPGSIVIAEEITPADAALMDPRRIAGFAAVMGGLEGNTVIMARSLSIPAVLGVAGLPSHVNSLDTVIVDGIAGRVIVNPTHDTIRRYERAREAVRVESHHLALMCGLPAVTRDGVAVSLQANIDLPVEVEAVRAAGAAGVGLLRTEFLFMNRDTVPDEEEQYQVYRSLLEAVGDVPVTVRTLDVGGDKLGGAVARQVASGANPALGLRAIRLSLRVRDLLRTQLAAMLRAGVHGRLRILLPLITTPSEVVRVRSILNEVAADLTARGVPVSDPLPPVGVMIEVPGAALAAHVLARVADFFSIGTNDLTMYTLAADRSDEQVAELYNPLHPGVLRLIKLTIEAAAQAALPVALCGEMAGERQYTALLLGLGLREFSVAAPSLARVKERIRRIDAAAAARRAEQVLEQTDAGRIAAMLDDFNGLL